LVSASGDLSRRSRWRRPAYGEHADVVELRLHGEEADQVVTQIVERRTRTLGFQVLGDAGNAVGDVLAAQTGPDHGWPRVWSSAQEEPRSPSIVQAAKPRYLAIILPNRLHDSGVADS
jgi:hypothetical protein